MTSEIIPAPEGHPPSYSSSGFNIGGEIPRASPAGHFLWLIKRRFWLVLAVVFTCVAITAGVSSLMTKQYEATATIDVDLRMPVGVLGSEAHQVSMLDADQFMATQLKLIQSDSVVREVANKYGLLEIEKQDRQWLDASPSARQKAPVHLRKLSVNRPPNTFLVQISYRSPDPLLSANVANAVADSYAAHVLDSRFRAAQGTSEFMEKQLDQLKAKMERSSDKLAQFERELSVINPEEKTNILSSRLVQINTEYTSAQADRMRKEAAANSMKSGSLDAAQASTQGEVLRKLSDRLNEAQERFAQLKTQFGPKHPDYKKAESDVSVLQGQMLRARDSIAARLDVEYRQAINREQILAKAVADTKAEFDHLNAKSFEYQTLKRDADSDKKIYDELFRKVQEAGINAGFQSSSIRVADPARPAVKPVSPDLEFNLLLALCLSTFAGIAAVVVLDERNDTITDPEQAWIDLRLGVAGMLPVIKKRRDPAESFVALKDFGPESASEAMFREGVHSIANTILLTARNRKVHSIAVTSSVPSEGKTTVAFHLALANAERNRRTLLIDADFRHPSVHTRFGMTDAPGLHDAITSHRPWQEFKFTKDSIPLDVLPAGCNAFRSAHLLGEAVRRVIQEASGEYDLIVVDSPPILGFPEPLEIAAAVDGTLVIALAGQTSRKVLAQSVQTLRNIGVPYIGLVLNRVSGRTTEGHYSSHYANYYKRHARRASA